MHPRRLIVAAVGTAATLASTSAAGQHEHEHAHGMEHGAMAMATPLGIPDSRDASGTSWQPDSTPMFMWHWMTGDWSLRLHTNVFAGYDNKRSDRGDDKLVSINWVMAMARHPLGAGDLELRAPEMAHGGL